MDTYIHDDAFLPKVVNDKQKTVTLPLEEYEQLVNAQKAADAEMRKAKSMIEKNEVRIVLNRIKDGYLGLCGVLYKRSPSVILPLDCIWSFGDKEVSKKLMEIIDEASNHVRQECGLKISECNAEVEKCRGIISEVADYNKKGALYRFFNEFKW